MTNSSANRINGDNPATQASAAFAILSAGPDRTFQTSCATAKTGAASGDDEVRLVTLAELNQATGGNAYLGDPVADTAALNALNTATIAPGEIRLVKSLNSLYEWNGSNWNQVVGASPYRAGKNMLINGNFDVWQRGTSNTAAVNTVTYVTDRWRLYVNNSQTVAASQYAFTPAEASAMPGAVYGLKLAPSSGTAYMELQQPIEGVLPSSGKTLTLSFYGKTLSGTQTVRMDLMQYYGSNCSPTPCSVDNYLNSNTPVTLNTGWQKFTYTIALPTANARTMGTNNDDYLSLNLIFDMSAGNAPNIVIAQVQVEEGSTASPFDFRFYTQELLDCQRYYERFDQGTAGNYYSTYSNGANANFGYPVVFRQVKRTPRGGASVTTTSSVINANSIGGGVYDTAHGFEVHFYGTASGMVSFASNWYADTDYYNY